MLKLHGKTGFILWTSIMKNVLIISLLFSLMQQGIITLCFVYVGVNASIYLIYAFNSGKVTGYNLTNQLKDILPFMASSLVMGGAMLLCNLIAENSLLILLSLQSVTGLFVISSIYFLFFRDEFSKVLNVFRKN